MSAVGGCHGEFGLSTSKPGMPFGREAGRRQLTALRDVVDDRLAVDRERHRATLLDVSDVLDVEPVVVGAETRVLLVLGRLLQPGDLVRRQALVEHVDLAGLERLHRGRAVGDHAAVDARQLDVGGVAPAVPLDQVDVGVVLPRLELERPVRDDVRRLGPLVAELLDGLLIDREERRVRRLLDEPRLRARQLDLEGRVVDGLDAHLVLQRVAVVLLGIAAVVLLRADDAVELVRVVGAELRARRCASTSTRSRGR